MLESSNIYIYIKNFKIIKNLKLKLKFSFRDGDL